MNDSISVGQRYVSDAEPELGLGLVVAVEARVIDLVFPAADEARRYVAGSAPLRRVRFAAGDTLSDDAGGVHRIDSVEERDGLLWYHSSIGELAEARVAARTAVTGPKERLVSGRTDPSAKFDLRIEAHTRLHEIRSSPVRGFAGPRVELLPHQFSVAAEVASRRLPRVLLADETGLGKTIEAGMILSRLILAGRAARVLVIVPDSLVHQWLVELRRRFQLRFAIYDEARTKAVEDSEPDTNPFLGEQLVLASISLFTGSPARTEQATEAGWDIVVVDEAHHLEWTRTHASDAYLAVEAVARSASGLLLLTATPEQLGAEGHFARLRLLDPDRYGDYDAWTREAGQYREAADAARAFLAEETVSAETAAALAKLIGQASADVLRDAKTERGRDALIARLIDRHGPGRVMLRNTRAAVRGFPERRVHRIALDESPERPAGDEPETLTARLDRELRVDLTPPDQRVDRPVVDDPVVDGPLVDGPLADDSLVVDPALALAGDPRIDWLVRFLAPTGPTKVLVICSTRAKAEAIEAAVAARIRVATAVFHEGLTLLQRDRNAAWFADAEGARLMICSELGSEGRNFQHAQNLVLFDVPIDPDLVEQRIGRLDRIGQRGTVEIHVPFVRASGHETLARWIDDGVGAMERPTLVGRALLERFGDRVRELALAAIDGDPARNARDLDALVAEAKAAAADLTERLEHGRDLLLEMASLRPAVAARLIDAVHASDEDPAFEDWFLRLLEHFHVYSEEDGERCYRLNPDGTQSPEFPDLDRGDTVLTFDRATALVREDFTFATRDHPLLSDAMELLLASQTGNASFALLDDATKPRLWLESVYVLEPIAPPRLHADRFLAPTPVRVVIDQHLAEPSEDEDPALVDLVDGRGTWIAENRASLTAPFERMAARTEEIAENRATSMRERASESMRREFDAEIARLEALAAVNPNVRGEEITELAAERDALEQAIATARLRADALRLIWQGPTKDGAPLLPKSRR